MQVYHLNCTGAQALGHPAHNSHGQIIKPAIGVQHRNVLHTYSPVQPKVA